MDWREKTVFQLLTTAKANTIDTLNQLNEIGIKHLDLNVGCPSRTVNLHGGGALKTPWLAYHKKNNILETSEIRVEMIKKYFFTLYKTYKDNSFTDKYLIKKFKVISRYIFDDLKEGSEFKKELFRSQDINTLLNLIHTISAR